MTFDQGSELGPGMGGPRENLNSGLSELSKSMAGDDNVVGNQRVLSDGSLYVEKENEHVQFTDRLVNGGNEHVTVPKGSSNNRGPHKTHQGTGKPVREDINPSDIGNNW